MKCLLVVINCCRPDFLGCYGNDWLASPAFDQLAAESVVFDQHFAQTPGEVNAARMWNRLEALLRPHGVKTQIITDLASAAVLTAIEWLRQHHKEDQWLLGVEISSLRPPWQEAEFDSQALEGSEEEALEPWFDAPMDQAGESLTAEDADRLRATYAGLVCGVDRCLEPLLGFLQDHDDEILLIVTSDNGLSLGEYGIVDEKARSIRRSSSSLHEEWIHIPLLMRMLGGVEAGRRVPQLTLDSDLVPTVCQAFGIPVTNLGPGHSLLPLARGEIIKRRDEAILSNKQREQWAIRTPLWYLTVAAPPAQQARLFSKPEDRWEINDVADQYREIAAELEQTLRGAAASANKDHLAEGRDIDDNR